MVSLCQLAQQSFVLSLQFLHSSHHQTHLGQQRLAVGTLARKRFPPTIRGNAQFVSLLFRRRQSLRHGSQLGRRQLLVAPPLRRQSVVFARNSRRKRSRKLRIPRSIVFLRNHVRKTTTFKRQKTDLRTASLSRTSFSSLLSAALFFHTASTTEASRSFSCFLFSVRFFLRMFGGNAPLRRRLPIATLLRGNVLF